MLFMDDPFLQSNNESENLQNFKKYFNARICAPALNAINSTQTDSRHFSKISLRYIQLLTPVGNLLAQRRYFRLTHRFKLQIMQHIAYSIVKILQIV